MICPKCRFEQEEGRTECARCGVLFARLEEHQAREAAGTVFRPRPTATGPMAPAGAKAGGSAGDDDPPFREVLRELLFDYGAEPGTASLAGRSLLFAFLFLWGCRFLLGSVESNYVGESFMHLINLPFHEAGHILFGFLGDFVRALGGTLGQLLIPAICLAAFLLQTRDPFAASVALWWLAENLMDIGPYMGDARSGQLLLLGGVTGRDMPGYHDWENVLGDLGLLRYDRALAHLTYDAGRLLTLAAFAWGGSILWRQIRARRQGTAGGG
jgi:hypothetical protein